MKLSEFQNLLETYPEKPFHLVLPGKDRIPVSFHITEVGHVVKKFIDCGGKTHLNESCQLQAWVWTDTEHRLLAGKMSDILKIAKAKDILPLYDLELEIEYEDVAISQYTVKNVFTADKEIILYLEAKHTDCLAKELCAPSSISVSCGSSSGCCGN